MKKLMILAVVCCLALTSCNNKAKEEPPCQKECPKQEMKDHPRCEMDEKCQKAMEDWKNWENLTDERKAELLNERKAAYDKKKAAEEEMKAKQAKFEELMGKWDQLSLDEKKAAFDLCPCCKDKCRKGGEGKCCKGGEGKCQKEGGCSKGPKPEGCPDKH
jgi:hypothetical protein